MGEVYESLYVQLKRDFGFGQAYYDASRQLLVDTPDEQWPEDPYYVTVYIDWVSEEYYAPFSAGMVIECINYRPTPIEPDWRFSFDPLT